MSDIKKNWTSSEDAIIIDRYPTEDTREMATLLDRTYSMVLNRAFTLGIKKTKEYMQKNGYRVQKFGVSTQFVKGHKPDNKGKKQTEYMSPEAIDKTKVSRFKKGQKPHNAKPNYYESIRKDKNGHDYIYIKDPNYKVMVGKHVYIWELHHGKVPAGHNIIFKDNDTKNCVIENLDCISNAENMKRNSLHNYPNEIKELTHLKAAINRQINKHSKTKTDDNPTI